MANILIFGDSIAYGDYDLNGGWVTRLKIHYMRKVVKNKLEKNVNLFNQSISGDTSIEVLSKLETETKPRVWSEHETIFIFAFGINDSILISNKPKVSLPVFESNLKKIYHTSSRYSEKIVFLGPTLVDESKVTPMPWSPTEYYYNERINKYNKAIKDHCNKTNSQFVDLFSKFSDLKYNKLLHDGCHLNTKGHETVFKIILQRLENGVLQATS
jgi:lysophospholipase L1-like esterase